MQTKGGVVRSTLKTPTRKGRVPRRCAGSPVTEKVTRGAAKANEPPMRMAGNRVKKGDGFPNLS